MVRLNFGRQFSRRKIETSSIEISGLNDKEAAQFYKLFKASMFLRRFVFSSIDCLLSYFNCLCPFHHSFWLFPCRQGAARCFFQFLSVNSDLFFFPTRPNQGWFFFCGLFQGAGFLFFSFHFRQLKVVQPFLFYKQDEK